MGWKEVNSQHSGGSLWRRPSKMRPHAICKGNVEVLSTMHQLKWAPDGQEILALGLVTAVVLFSVFSCTARLRVMRGSLYSKSRCGSMDGCFCAWLVFVEKTSG